MRARRGLALRRLGFWLRGIGSDIHGRRRGLSGWIVGSLVVSRTVIGIGVWFWLCSGGVYDGLEKRPDSFDIRQRMTGVDAFLDDGLLKDQLGDLFEQRVGQAADGIEGFIIGDFQELPGAGLVAIWKRELRLEDPPEWISLQADDFTVEVRMSGGILFIGRVEQLVFAYIALDVTFLDARDGRFVRFRLYSWLQRTASWPAASIP